MIEEIKVIYGGAGCGKTQRLVEEAVKAEAEHKTFIILAPTHSAKHNLFERFEKLEHPLSKELFKTTYSYFHINWEKNDVIGPKNFYDIVFIDEFGLIKKELFKKMMSALNVVKNNIKVIIAGDVVQLSPIYEEKVYISTTRLNKYYEKVPSYITEHDYKSLFSLKYIRDATKDLLKHNYRSDSNVLKIIHSIFYEKDLSVVKTITLSKVVYLIINKGYVFISSKYELHDLVYKTIVSQLPNKIIIKDLAFYEGASFMVVENTRQVHNGDILKFVKIEQKKVILKKDDDTEIEWDNNFKITPAQLLTSHKAQGLSIPKVIVCIDDMFDISMFYTMCTRAMSDLKFFTYKRVINSEELSINVNKFHDLLEFYNY